MYGGEKIFSHRDFLLSPSLEGLGVGSATYHLPPTTCLQTTNSRTKVAKRSALSVTAREAAF